MASSTCGVLDAAPVLRESEFQQFRQLAYEHFGLDLGGGKQGLVAARLGKKLGELGLSSFQQYFDLVKADRSGAELSGLIDNLTTNHTSFFREPMHFDLLTKTILPELKDHARIDIWSAACSSGEEPYTIAMAVLDGTPAAIANRVKIKATDISTRVLAKAKQGIYSAEQLRGVPETLLRRSMLKGRNHFTDCFRFKPEVRAMIDFGHINLMAPFPAGYRCQVIFCRNVMIYFDKPTQQNLVQRLVEQLEVGGYLLIGHSESLNGAAAGLEHIAPATYRKPGRPRADRMGRG